MPVHDRTMGLAVSAFQGGFHEAMLERGNEHITREQVDRFVDDKCAKITLRPIAQLVHHDEWRLIVLAYGIGLVSGYNACRHWQEISNDATGPDGIVRLMVDPKEEFEYILEAGAHITQQILAQMGFESTNDDGRQIGGLFSQN